MSHKYDYSVDPSLENAAAPKVVRLVGTQRRVLEIGSGPGSITRVLKEKNGCVITAVEIDEEAARLVQPFCEDVIRCNLNHSSWVSAVSKKGNFDVVVAADVLEHLYDPWTVLSQIKEVLSPGGAVVISLPHAAHNSVIASLLNGDLDYRKVGLLDGTHIRFFGLKNIQQLLEKAGFAIVEASFVGKHASQTELNDQWNVLPPSTRRLLNQNPYGCIYQVVLKAVPATAGITSLQLTSLPLPDLSQTLLGTLKTRLANTLLPYLSESTKRRLKRIIAAK